MIWGVRGLDGLHRHSGRQQVEHVFFFGRPSVAAPPLAPWLQRWMDPRTFVTCQRARASMAEDDCRIVAYESRGWVASGISGAVKLEPSDEGACAPEIRRGPAHSIFRSVVCTLPEGSGAIGGGTSRKRGRKRAKCEYGRQKSPCKDSEGSGVCEHGRIICKECGGSSGDNDGDSSDRDDSDRDDDSDGGDKSDGNDDVSVDRATAADAASIDGDGSDGHLCHQGRQRNQCTEFGGCFYSCKECPSSFQSTATAATFPAHATVPPVGPVGANPLATLGVPAANADDPCSPAVSVIVNRRQTERMEQGATAESPKRVKSAQDAASTVAAVAASTVAGTAANGAAIAVATAGGAESGGKRLCPHGRQKFKCPAGEPELSRKSQAVETARALMFTCQTSVRDPTRPIPQAHMDLWRAFVRHRLKDIPCTSDGSDWAQVKCVHGRQDSRCKACGSRLRPTSDASSGARANAPARTERGGRIPVCLHRRSRSTRKECGGAQKSAGAPHTNMLSQASAAELARWIELNIALSTVVGADGSIQYRYWIRRAGARAHGRPDFFRNTTGRFAAFRTPIANRRLFARTCRVRS